MSDNLPVPRPETLPDRISNGHVERRSGLSGWIGSPLGRAVAQALPDVLRMASRPTPEQPRPFVSQILPSSDGASGVTLSEVEVDVDVPFIRRVTIRSASSWSVAPDVIVAEKRQQRRSRWKLRALAAGALGIASVVLARRSGITLPARLNPASSLPFASTTPPAISEPAKRNPGTAE